MEQRIELEIRLRELAAHSLLEARNEIDVLEVEKSLLTSDQRMNCYAHQLESQRKRLSNPSLSTADSGRGSKSSSTVAGNKQQAATITRSDVVGQSSSSGLASDATNSPSFSSLSNSQSSPSKLSPVSGQSTNSPTNDTAKVSPGGHSGNNKEHLFRRQSGYSSSHSNSNTLNRRHKNGPQDQMKRRREQLMQSITSLSNINCNMVTNNKASLSLSELRIPLMWRDVDHFKGRGDYKRYAVFCLLKINSQIFDTQLISDVDRQMTDLNFDDVIVFNDLDRDFELSLEVYSCVYLEQFSLSSTPRKLKEKLSSSVSRAMGRRLATQTASANYTKELQAYDKSYRFAMIASARLRLDDASDQVKTYDLALVSPSAHHRHSTHNNNSNSHLLMTTSDYYNSTNNNSTAAGLVTASNQKDAHKNTLPLFGHFCCKLNVKPDVFDKNVKIGYLRIADINLQATNGQTTGRPSSQSPSGTTRSSSSAGGASVGSADSNSDSSMLRSALAASSKLATLSMSSSTIHWALLRNFALHLWPVDEQKLELALARGQNPQVDISRKPPFSMSIDKYTKLLRVSNSSLTIETDRGCFVLAVYNLPNQDDEIGHWLRPIEQYIYDSHIWGSVLNHYPPQATAARHQSLTKTTPGSESNNQHDRRRHRTPPKSATRLTSSHALDTSLDYSLNNNNNSRNGKQHEHRHSNGAIMQADL